MKNTLYRLLLLPWLLLAAWGAQAQAPAWTGAAGLTPGTAGNNVVLAVATNAAGDVFIAGTYNGSATFGTLPALTSQGGTDDMYVAKWSAANSNWVWAVSGGSSTDADGAYGIAVNGNNVYVTGSYNGTATISGSSLTAVSSGFDLFVAKYVDGGTSVSNGGAVSGGGGGSDRGLCVAFNGTTVYVGGYYTGATTATISGSSLTGASNNNVFLAKYTDTGTGLNSLQNSNAVGAATTGTERATSIAVNGTTIYLGGYFNGASLPIGGTTLTNNTSGTQDLFIARYTDAGTLTAGGAVSGGGSASDRVTGLAVNGTAVYATGFFDSGSATIAGTNLSANGGTTTPTGANDIYVAKYTDTGSGLTGAGAVSNTGSSSDDESLGIAASGSTIYITGYFSAATTIAGTALSAPTGGSDVFVAKYSDTGSLQGQGAISGGTGTANPPDAGTAIAASGTQVVAAGIKDPASAATFGSFTVPSGPTGFFARVGVNSTTITSIVPASTNPTNAASVQFTVTFAASVSGLTAANFTTANGGSVTGSSVTSVSAGPGTTYTVTVNTGSGSGTLGLTLANSTGITPSVSNVPFTGTPLYTIDKTAPVPTITSGTAANGGSTSTSPIAYTVTFSETVTGFIASEVTVGNGTLTGFTAVSGTTYTFNVTPTANGAVTVSVAAGVAQDAVGNNNVVSTPNPYSITYTAPTATVTSISKLVPTAAQSTTGTATTQVRFTVTFSAAVSGVTTSNFSLTQTTSGASIASVSPATGPSATYTVVVNTGTGNGTLQLNVANATGITPSVTNTPYNGTSAVYTITKSFNPAPSLTVVGTGGTGSDVTAFVDVAQVLSGGSTFANGLQNGSFETHDALASGNFGYNPTGAVWTFNAQSGIAESGSAFTPITPIPDGIAVAFLQSNGGGNGQIQQNLAVPNGSTYQVRFQTSQRNCCTTGDQALNVFLNGVFIGTVQPANNNAYTTFTSETFAITGAPALTATVSTTSPNPTSTSPIPFSVTFSQSVGTTFMASGVTVTGGTVTSGPTQVGSTNVYNFAVTPSGAGTVTVSVPAGAARDANNTPNTASNPVSIQYQPATAAPVLNQPANVADGQPLFTGTAPANSAIVITVVRNGGGTTTYSTTANGSGNFSYTLTQAQALAIGTYTVTATAQTSGNAISAASNQKTFVVPTDGPTTVITSTAPNPTTVAPIPVTVTFSRVVTGFDATDVTATNSGGGTTTVSIPTSGDGKVYTFNVTPSTTGLITVGVAANVAQDSLSRGNLAATSLTRQYNQPATAAPTITAPTNNSFTNQDVTLSGTAPANSTVMIYVLQGGTQISGSPVTVTATPSGTFSLGPVPFPEGTYQTYATAQNPNSSVSPASPTITFTVDTTSPTVTLNSGTVANGGTTSTSPVSFTATFNEPVTNFTNSGILVNNGTVTSGPTQVGTTNAYTFQVTPSGAGTVVVQVLANAAKDRAGNNNAGSTAYSFTYALPVTAAPVVTTPASGSLVATSTPTYSGTAPANSTVTVYVDGVALSGTVTADGSGNWSKTQPTTLSQGSHTVYARAQSSGSSQSGNSNTNTFTVDSVAPTATVSTTSGSPTSTSPIPFTVTFSEGVTGFAANKVTVTGGTLSGFTPGAGNTYTFNVTPAGTSSLVTVSVAANQAQDAAGNGNTASNSVSVQFQAPTIVVAPATLPGGTQGTFYSTTFSASGGSGSYTYTMSAPVPGLTLMGATLSGTPTGSGSYTFTIIAIDNSAAPGPYSGSRTYTLVIAAPAVTAVTWTGGVSTDWFTAANWSPTTVPDATIDAIIPTAPSGNRFPVIAGNASQATAKSVSIATGASLAMSANTLTIAGNLTNNGTFNGFTGSGGTATGGTVVVGGSALSSLNGGGVTRFWNLTVGANGAQQSGSASSSVSRLLTLNGNFASNNALTLVSDAVGTAMVVNSGGVVTGNATVQRYIDPTLNPNLGYRHVSPAVSGATISSLTTGSYSPVVNPAYNGSATPLAIRPFPTVYGYDQSRLATTSNNLTIFDKGWFSPDATSDPLPVGLGRTVLIAANQTWNFTGTLNNGDRTLNLGRNSGATAAQSGLAFVGNPYPSPLDWSLVGSGDRTNVDNLIYVYRSNNPANPYLGAYGSYNNGAFAGGLASTVLAQGQGFFVRVTQGTTAGSLTFKNTQRVSTYQSPTYGRTAETRPFVRLSLQGTGSSDADDAVVYFEQGATAGNDGEYDAEKLSNPSGLNVSTNVSADLRMAINGLSPLGTAQLVVPVSVGVPAVGSYTLKAAQLLNLGSVPTYLRDRLTGAVIDLAAQPSYQFTVSDASALLTGRFELVFSPQAPLATATAALAQQVGLYPNPTTGSAFVELPAQLGRTVVTASLVDALGREVRTVSLPAQGAVAHRLDLRELPSGVYMLRLNTSAGTLVKKLTVE